MLDATQRRWARLLDTLPENLGQCTRWLGPVAEEGLGHLHYSPTLVIGLTGVVRIECSRGHHDLRPGEALLIAAGVRHQHAPLRAGSLWFGQGFIATWSDVGIFGDPSSWYSRVPAHPSRRNLAQALEVPEEGLNRCLRRHLVELLHDVELPTMRIGAAAQRMLEALHRGAHTGLNGAGLVSASGLSRGRAYAIFRDAFGLSPHQAILQARLSLAESLRAAGLPPAVVAARVGFASRRSFNRARRRTPDASGSGRDPAGS